MMNVNEWMMNVRERCCGQMADRSVFGQEFRQFCFQNPLFESFWNASIPSAGAMTTKWQARCIALQTEKFFFWPEKSYLIIIWRPLRYSQMVSLAFLRFTSEMSLGRGVSLMLVKIDQIEAFLVKSLFSKEDFGFQNPLFESFWNASIPSAGAMTTKWQARCIALQNEWTRKSSFLAGEKTI